MAQKRGEGGQVSVHHADVVGSLLAPPELAAAMSYPPVREVTAAEPRELQDRAIGKALAVQQRAEVDVVSDCEPRRIQFFDQFVVGIEGLALGPGGAAKFRFDDGETVEFRVPVCVQERVKAIRNLARGVPLHQGQDRRDDQGHAPESAAADDGWKDDLSRAAYRDPLELLADGAELIRVQIVALRDASCEYVQVDAPELLQGFADPDMQAERSGYGIDPERFKAEGIEYMNAAFDVPGIRRAVHLCGGNYAGMRAARGGYGEWRGAVSTVLPTSTCG